MGRRAAIPASYEPGEETGPLETAVREDVAALKGVSSSLAELAYSLAQALDRGAGVATAAVGRELRATMKEIVTSASKQDDADAFLASVVGHSAPR